MNVMEKSIVFFGSGPVSAMSLQLLAENFTIEAVITKPKPENHRGDYHTLLMAEKLGLKTFTPANKKELSDLMATNPIQSQIGVVIDYGIIITQDVIDHFPFGIINSHFSLLPEWRGADPLSFSILSGQKKTGVSVMVITAGLDEGPLLGQTEYEIKPDETTPSLTKELVYQSDGALSTILPMWVSGETKPFPQELVTLADNKEPTYSRKLIKTDGLIDWHNPAIQIEREIRAFVDWPKSYANLGGIDIVVTKASVIKESGPPGKIELSGKKLLVYCGQDALSVENLKPAGKPEMDAVSFLNGYGKKLAI